MKVCQLIKMVELHPVRLTELWNSFPPSENQHNAAMKNETWMCASSVLRLPFLCLALSPWVQHDWSGWITRVELHRKTDFYSSEKYFFGSRNHPIWKQPSLWVHELEVCSWRQTMRLHTGYKVTTRDYLDSILWAKKVSFVYFCGESVDFQPVVFNFHTRSSLSSPYVFHVHR